MNLAPLLSIQQMSASELAPTQAFYQSVGYHSAISPLDAVFIAKLSNTIIGAVRVRTEHDLLVLRGMQVAPEHRAHQVGKRLLSMAMEYVGQRECYCIPRRHLVHFYATVGFQVMGETQVPSILAERVARYRNEGLDVVVMHKVSGEPLTKEKPPNNNRQHQG